MVTTTNSDAASTGALTLRLEPQAFVDIDHACVELIDQLTRARSAAGALARHPSWGLGEQNPRLFSAVELAALFRAQAAGGADNAHDALSRYLTAAEDIRRLFQTVCREYETTDAEFAARLREITA